MICIIEHDESTGNFIATVDNETKSDSSVQSIADSNVHVAWLWAAVKIFNEPASDE